MRLIQFAEPPVTAECTCVRLFPNARATANAALSAQPALSILEMAGRIGNQPVATLLQSHRLFCEAASDYPDPLGAAASLLPVIREIFRSDADLTALESLKSPRIQKLAKLARRYRDCLRDEGLIDASELLWEAIKQNPEKRPILVHGYPRLGRDDIAFLEAIAGEGSILVLPCLDAPLFEENRSSIEFLKSRGWQVAGEPEKGTPFEVPSEITRMAYVYPNQDEEVRGVLTEVKRLLQEGVPASEIVLVARDDARYGPKALAIAWEYGIPLRAFYDVSLSETRLGSWICLLEEAMLSNWDFEPTFRLLCHPLSPRLASDERAAVKLNHPCGKSAWQQVTELPLDWPESAPRGEWVGLLRKLLIQWDIRKQAGRWSREMLAYNALVDALPQMAAPADQRVDRGAFLQELRIAMTLLGVPAQPGHGGVALHTPLSIFGARYRHVLVLGMAESLFPAPISEPLALDYLERKKLKEIGVILEDAASAVHREQLSFWALLRVATERFLFTYPAMLDNKELLPSPYFQLMGLRLGTPPNRPLASIEEARKVEILWEEPSADPDLPLIRRNLSIEEGRQGGKEDEYGGIIGLPIDPGTHRFSPSQLLTLGQCPFKWFSAKLLRLEEPQEAEDDLPNNLKGSLYHKTLEIALEMTRESQDRRSAMLEVLEEAWLEAEHNLQDPLPVLPAWEHRRREFLRQLRQAVEAPDFIRDDAEVIAIERSFEGEWCGLTVRGQVDRADRTPEGLVLIDYKTSGSLPKGAKDDKGELKLDVQLPLYSKVAAPAFALGERVSDTYYYSLTKGKRLNKSKPGEDEANEEALSAFAEKVKAHLQGGAYPVEPDKKRDACTYCDFEYVCRCGEEDLDA